MVSTARVLYEVERRVGPISSAPQIEVALYAGYLLDGGTPGDEAGFDVYIDGADIAAVTAQLDGILGDPTVGETGGTPSSASPSPSPADGT
jgi:hypothetical protein